MGGVGLTDLIDLRDRTLVGWWLPQRRRPLNRAVEGGLVLPHVVRVRQDGPRLDPDKPLVDEQASGCPGRLDEGRPTVGVPLVDRGVRRQKGSE